MRRLFPLLLLLPLATPILCRAAPDHDADKATIRRDACVDAHPSPTATIADADARRAPLTAPATARSLPKPGTSADTSAAGDSETMAPRVRSTRWHSFLPGMFR